MAWNSSYTLAAVAAATLGHQQCIGSTSSGSGSSARAAAFLQRDGELRQNSPNSCRIQSNYAIALRGLFYISAGKILHEEHTQPAAFNQWFQSMELFATRLTFCPPDTQQDKALPFWLQQLSSEALLWSFFTLKGENSPETHRHTSFSFTNVKWTNELSNESIKIGALWLFPMYTNFTSFLKVFDDFWLMVKSTLDSQSLSPFFSRLVWPWNQGWPTRMVAWNTK